MYSSKAFTCNTTSCNENSKYKHLEVHIVKVVIQDVSKIFIIKQVYCSGK